MLNLANPDDEIVVIVSGAFGNRFKQIAENNVHIFEVEWGKAVNVPDFIDFLKSLNTNITAVYSQYCETSTAVLHPVSELGHALKAFDESIYFVVDGVSCIGAVDVDLQRDAIDVLISGSQKAIMLPPGLAFVAYNDRAKNALVKLQHHVLFRLKQIFKITVRKFNTFHTECFVIQRCKRIRKIS